MGGVIVTGGAAPSGNTISFNVVQNRGLFALTPTSITSGPLIFLPRPGTGGNVGNPNVGDVVRLGKVAIPSLQLGQEWGTGNNTNGVPFYQKGILQSAGAHQMNFGCMEDLQLNLVNGTTEQQFLGLPTSGSFAGVIVWGCLLKIEVTITGTGGLTGVSLGDVDSRKRWTGGASGTSVIALNNHNITKISSFDATALAQLPLYVPNTYIPKLFAEPAGAHFTAGQVSVTAFFSTIGPDGAFEPHE